MAMFLWGRWRHDMVALGALLACVFARLVPGREAFAGFGHPAVITIAGVLVLGYSLQISGAVDVLAKRLLPHCGGADFGADQPCCLTCGRFLCFSDPHLPPE